VSVIFSYLLSDTADRLGKTGDIGHLLGRLLREELEELFGREAAQRGNSSQGRRLPFCLIVSTQETDCLEVAVGEIDPDVRRELSSQRLVPLVVFGQKSFVVDVDLVTGDHCQAHT